MEVSPRFTFWFGVATNVLLFVAGYGIKGAPASVAAYAPDVQWWAGMLGQLNGVVLTALVGVSSKSPGPLAPK